MNAFSVILDGIKRWEGDGCFVREAVFSHEENDLLFIDHRIVVNGSAGFV